MLKWGDQVSHWLMLEGRTLIFAVRCIALGQLIHLISDKQNCGRTVRLCTCFPSLQYNTLNPKFNEWNTTLPSSLSYEQPSNKLLRFKTWQGMRGMQRRGLQENWQRYPFPSPLNEWVHAVGVWI
ncbi:UNVERIFIED_CONTAM: hypothetical protein K2H54_044136 [Gekko kuhli]